MKLIFAIIRYDNEDEVVNALTQKRFSITKLSSTGGFLRKGNTTLMIGTEMPMNVEVGGATIFVIDVEDYEKI